MCFLKYFHRVRWNAFRTDEPCQLAFSSSSWSSIWKSAIFIHKAVWTFLLSFLRGKDIIKPSPVIRQTTCRWLRSPKTAPPQARMMDGMLRWSSRQVCCQDQQAVGTLKLSVELLTTRNGRSLNLPEDTFQKKLSNVMICDAIPVVPALSQGSSERH